MTAAAGDRSETRAFVQRAEAANGRLYRLRDELKRRTRLTNSGLALAAVAVVFWLLGYLVAGRPLYLIAYGCVAVIGVSSVSGRRQLPLVGDRGDARPRLKEGETVNMALSLTATKRLSTFILEERVPPLLGRDARIPVASLAPGDSVEHRYALACWRRGNYELGPLYARWGDPFGLTEREQKLADSFEVLVHPQVQLVSDRPLTRLWEDPPIRPPISKPWPHGMEFYGMREYQPGDDVRKIVWRAYARTQKLLVRESEQGITDKMTLVLDQNSRTHSPGAVSDSFEVGIRAAASLAVRHLNEGYSVTVEGNDGRLAGPVRGPQHGIAILDQLARAELRRDSMADALKRMVVDPHRDAHVVVVTPHLDRDCASWIRMLIERGSNVLVAALIWDEDATDLLAEASVLGAQVVEIRPDTPLSRAFYHEVGARRL